MLRTINHSGDQRNRWRYQSLCISPFCYLLLSCHTTSCIDSFLVQSCHLTRVCYRRRAATQQRSNGANRANCIQADGITLYAAPCVPAPRVKAGPRHRRRNNGAQHLPEIHKDAAKNVDNAKERPLSSPSQIRQTRGGLCARPHKERRASLPQIAPPKVYFKGLRRNSISSFADIQTKPVMSVGSSMSLCPRKYR